jgi:O-antigen/teichoic acid export membrane protein
MSIIKETKWVAGSLYLSKFITIPCSITIARILGPTLYGNVSIIRLIISYSSFLQLGIFDGLTREIPLEIGRERNKIVDEYKKSAFSISLIVSALGSTALLLYALYNNSYNNTINQGIKIISFAIFFGHLYGFYQYLLRAEEKFILLSKIRIAHILLTSITQVIGVLLIGINGIFYAILVINATITIVVFSCEPIKISISTINLVKPLLLSGFPMLLNGVADLLLFTIDRIMIVAFIGQRGLGLYAIAILVSSMIDFIPASLQSVVLPKLLRQNKTTNMKNEMSMLWIQPLQILSCFLPVVAGLVWICAPVGIKYILPKYIHSINAVKILIISSCFTAIIGITRNIFIVKNKQYRVLFAFLICSIIGIVLNLLFIKLNMGITGVALATCITFMILSAILLNMALKIQNQYGAISKFMIKLYFPVLLTLTCLVSLDYIFSSQQHGIGTAVLSMLGRALLFIVVEYIYIYVFHRNILRMICPQKKIYST